MKSINLLELEPICGIYKILCISNHKIYVGYSNYITYRIINHIDHLIKNSHSNKELQRDFRIYGLSSFEFEIIEEFCGTRIEMVRKETEYVDKFRSDGLYVYNNSSGQAGTESKYPRRWNEIE